MSEHFQEPAGSPSIHTLPIRDVFERLRTRADGLPQSEAEERLRQVGRNVLHEVPRESLIVKLLANFTHLMAILLWVGGLIGFVAGLPQLGCAIWLVVLINGGFSFWQEYKAEKASEALRRMLPSFALVVRDGSEQRIAAEELVPGDVLLLAEGDLISADARIMEETELRVDQSTLTGESRPVRKTTTPALHPDLPRSETGNLVFAGTSVVAGVGKAVVFATAMNTEFGKIAHLTQSVREELSPLQREMAHVTRVVSLIASVVGLFFFGLGISLGGMKLAEAFVFMMGMIVAFVPEGLLPTVTLALALGVQRMSRRNALVKRLSAVETLGCTTVICTDKTGTLTQNQMTVCDVWLNGRHLTVTGAGYDPTGQLLHSGQVVDCTTDDDLAELLRAAALCNDARVLPPNGERTQWSVLGDPTEAALLVLARKGNLHVEAETLSHPRLRELPFDSRRKLMSTLHQPAVTSSGVGAVSPVAYVKGALHELLARCSRIRVDGADLPLDARRRADVATVNDEFARNALRVLAVARRTLNGVGCANFRFGRPVAADSVDASPAKSEIRTPDPCELTAAGVEQDLTLLGLVAMLDPPRPEVAAAVAKCHRAGIRILMITGDYGLTAESIAARIGIIRRAAPRLLNGTDLDALDDRPLKEILQDEVILARGTPEHKLRVVRLLQEMGHVVAVTGDGVNDAPALKQADIGVAMGLAGTDVAKEAADMILTDDNFASIVNAIEEGRAVYANIKKFISYIFTSNTPEAVPFILYAFSGGRIPLALTVMQILSIDLGTDMVPALALGAEPPEPGTMKKPPRNLKEHAISPALLWRAYVWLGLIQSVAAMSAFYFVFWMNGHWRQWLGLPSSGPLYRLATSMTLAAVVATQIGNLFAHRTEQVSVFRVGLCTNRLVWWGIATELVVLILIVYVPALQWLFGTAAIPLEYWLFLLAWVPALFGADEFRKAAMRKTHVWRNAHRRNRNGG